MLFLTPKFSQCIGIILTSPRNFTFVPGITPSPIQLTCDVTPVAVWVVNNNTVLLNRLGTIGHGVNGTNIVINNPMNNSEYLCSDGTNDGEPYHIFVAGKYMSVYQCISHTYLCMYTRIISAYKLVLYSSTCFNEKLKFLIPMYSSYVDQSTTSIAHVSLYHRLFTVKLAPNSNSVVLVPTWQ